MRLFNDALNNMKRLPNKPSKLLEVALADLRKCEKSPDYDIKMGVWHEPPSLNHSTCQVCLAGAVMAKSLKICRTKCAYPTDDNFNETIERKLRALNAFRVGVCSDGFMYMDLQQSQGCLFNRFMNSYHGSPSKFYEDMQHLIIDLKKAGY